MPEDRGNTGGYSLRPKPVPRTISAPPENPSAASPPPSNTSRVNPPPRNPPASRTTASTSSFPVNIPPINPLAGPSRTTAGGHSLRPNPVHHQIAPPPEITPPKDPPSGNPTPRPPTTTAKRSQPHSPDAVTERSERLVRRRLGNHRLGSPARTAPEPVRNESSSELSELSELDESPVRLGTPIPDDPEPPQGESPPPVGRPTTRSGRTTAQPDPQHREFSILLRTRALRKAERKSRFENWLSGARNIAQETHLFYPDLSHRCDRGISPPLAFPRVQPGRLDLARDESYTPSWDWIDGKAPRRIAASVEGHDDGVVQPYPTPEEHPIDDLVQIRIAGSELNHREIPRQLDLLDPIVEKAKRMVVKRPVDIQASRVADFDKRFPPDYPWDAAKRPQWLRGYLACFIQASGELSYCYNETSKEIQPQACDKCHLADGVFTECISFNTNGWFKCGNCTFDDTDCSFPWGHFDEVQVWCSGDLVARVPRDIKLNDPRVQSVKDLRIQRPIELREHRLKKFQNAHAKHLNDPDPDDTNAIDKWLGTYIQATGKIQHQPCHGCTSGGSIGVFQECIIIDGGGMGCGNCKWNARRCVGAQLKVGDVAVENEITATPDTIVIENDSPFENEIAPTPEIIVIEDESSAGEWEDVQDGPADEWEDVQDSPVASREASPEMDAARDKHTDEEDRISIDNEHAEGDDRMSIDDENTIEDIVADHEDGMEDVQYDGDIQDVQYDGDLEDVEYDGDIEDGTTAENESAAEDFNNLRVSPVLSREASLEVDMDEGEITDGDGINAGTFEDLHGPRASPVPSPEEVADEGEIPDEESAADDLALTDEMDLDSDSSSVRNRRELAMALDNRSQDLRDFYEGLRVSPASARSDSVEITDEYIDAFYDALDARDALRARQARSPSARPSSPAQTPVSAPAPVPDAGSSPSARSSSPSQAPVSTPAPVPDAGSSPRLVAPVNRGQQIAPAANVAPTQQQGLANAAPVQRVLQDIPVNVDQAQRMRQTTNWGAMRRHDLTERGSRNQATKAIRQDHGLREPRENDLFLPVMPRSPPNGARAADNAHAPAGFAPGQWSFGNLRNADPNACFPWEMPLAGAGARAPSEVDLSEKRATKPSKAETQPGNINISATAAKRKDPPTEVVSVPKRVAARSGATDFASLYGIQWDPRPVSETQDSDSEDVAMLDESEAADSEDAAMSEEWETASSEDVAVSEDWEMADSEEDGPNTMETPCHPPHHRRLSQIQGTIKSSWDMWQVESTITW